MSNHEKFYPNEENLGQNCMFWSGEIGCFFPKVELGGRRSCEGMVDDVCLYVKDGRPPKSLTKDQINEIKHHIPGEFDKSYLPPGSTT